jgi:putative membrane protein
MLSNAYPWIKALHLFSIIAWMTGIFYLPRLFVYHAGVARESEAASLFQVMERRLYKIIMRPAMFLSLASGIVLAMIPGIVNWRSGWFHLKILSVVGLIFYHFMLNHWRLALATGGSFRPIFFRIINEIPTLLLIVILISVFVKPF